MFGDKVKQLRNKLNLTQEQLADSIEISEKTIYRYESNKANPDIHSLIRLSQFFAVSIDYLLGLLSYEEMLKQEKSVGLSHGNDFYKKYVSLKSNYTFYDDASYYWIFSIGDKIGGQTMWDGWLDNKAKIERRVLREVNPVPAMQLCKETKGNPAVINSEEDAKLFLLFGGHAIIKKDVCEKFLPQFIEPYYIKSGENIDLLDSECESM